MIDFSSVPFPTARELENQEIKARLAAESASVSDSQTFIDYPGAIVDLNLDGAKRALKIFEDKIHHWESEANALTVNSAEAAANATEMIGMTKRLAKQIDDRRKEIIAEPDSFVRKVNGFCKPFSDRLKALEAYIKRKLGDYDYQIVLQRREIERKQREAAAKLQEDLNKEAAAKGVEPVQVVPVAVPTRKEPTRSDSAVASSVIVWKHEVTDPKAVPREYLMVDDAAIKAAIRAGIRNIDGVRIYEEAEVRVRKIG